MNLLSVPLHYKAIIEREAAIFSQVWFLTPPEREKLDTHVALRTSLREFGDRMFEDEEDCLKDKIVIGAVTYEVHYLNCSATQLCEKHCEDEDMQLVLSLRAINSRGFAVCLVQPRWEGMSEEKWLKYREVVFS